MANYIALANQTLTLTAGSKNFTIANMVVNHSMNDLRVDDELGCAGLRIPIASITAGGGTLSMPWPGSNQSTTNWYIARCADTRYNAVFAANQANNANSWQSRLLGQATPFYVTSILNTPPSSPTNGDRHLVDTSPSGAFAGLANNIVERINNAWVPTTPRTGDFVHVTSSSILLMWNGAAWVTTNVLASNVTLTPTGDVSATNVQAAIAELAAEKVPTTRSVATSTGLTGGGDLSSNRTLTFDVSWGDARYSLAARSFTTGTGLTGGGDFTTNRVISLDLTYADSRYARLGAANNFTAQQTISAAYPAMSLAGTDNVNAVELLFYRQGQVRRALSELPGGVFNIARFSGGAFAANDLSFSSGGVFTFAAGGSVGGNFYANGGFLNANNGTAGGGTITVGTGGNGVIRGVNGGGLFINDAGYGTVTAYQNWSFGGSVASGGSVTIGTGGSQGPGSIYSDANWGMLFRPRVAGVSAAFGWVSHDNNFIRMHLTNSGALTLSGYGAGTLVTDASGNVTASSDMRLKTDIAPFTKGLEVVRQLRPVSHKWSKESGYDQLNTYYGLIAQEVEEVFPEAVGMDPRGFLTLMERPIVASLINSINEMDAMITSLLARIEALETA